MNERAEVLALYWIALHSMWNSCLLGRRLSRAQATVGLSATNWFTDSGILPI